MFSFLSKRLYPTLYRPKLNRSKFYDVQEVQKDIDRSLQQIALLQRSIGELDEAIDFNILEQLKMLSVYHSNALEGSCLSLEDTVAFLQNDVINENISERDHMDALGHAAAIGFIGSTLRCGERIDRNLVCEVNDLLTKHVESIPTRSEKVIVSGTYKIAPNSVLQADGEVFNYVAPELVPAEMEELFQYCETSNAHPVVKAAIAHYNFVRIHPFQHGNGRGARILMSLILQHYNLPPAVIQVQDKEKYLDCLHLADQGNILPFIGFVAHSLIQTMQLVLGAYQDEHAGSQQCMVGC